MGRKSVKFFDLIRLPILKYWKLPDNKINQQNKYCEAAFEKCMPIFLQSLTPGAGT